MWSTFECVGKFEENIFVTFAIYHKELQLPSQFPTPLVADAGTGEPQSTLKVGKMLSWFCGILASLDPYLYGKGTVQWHLS